MQFESGRIVEPTDRTENDQTQRPEKHHPLVPGMLRGQRIGHGASNTESAPRSIRQRHSPGDRKCRRGLRATASFFHWTHARERFRSRLAANGGALDVSPLKLPSLDASFFSGHSPYPLLPRRPEQLRFNNNYNRRSHHQPGPATSRAGSLASLFFIGRPARESSG
jgi:hypothetical protein